MSALKLLRNPAQEEWFDLPLVVDLDGTLLKSDLLLESGLAFLRSHAARCLEPLLWLSQGKATLKENLARATSIDVTVLPYDEAVIALIESERRAGRKIVLATASHRLLAERIAEHLGLFDEVLASDAGHNLAADHKRDALVEHYGVQGFDYVGNSHDDLPVWSAARRAYVANPENGVERRARQLARVEAVLHGDPPALRDWLKALRLHQWLKNLLIFVPMLAAHRLSEPQALGVGVLAFLFFGLCASSVYLLNDLLDLGDDRHHPTKRWRPFAAGRLSIRQGLFAFPTLLAAAFGGAWMLLPPQFTGVLVLYYGLTLAYSLVLKRRMVVDVIALAMLYTLRIVAGAAALGLALTFWILAFSMFLFLSLALVKRYAELHQRRSSGQGEKTRGRGYYTEDLGMIASLGAAAGYLAVMVLALYIHDHSTISLYRNPELIWLACPLLLFWIIRVWMLTYRGKMHDDPVVFALRDHTSLVVGLLFGVVFWAAA